MSKKDLFQKLARVQAQLGNVPRRGYNPHFKSDYVLMSDLLDSLRPLLEKEGLLVVSTFEPPAEAGDPWTLVTSVIDAETGDSIDTPFPLLMRDYGNPQQWGAAASYARRYTMFGLFNVVGEDDDGSAAAGLSTPAPSRAAQPRSATKQQKKPPAVNMEEQAASREDVIRKIRMRAKELALQNYAIKPYGGKSAEERRSKSQEMLRAKLDVLFPDRPVADAFLGDVFGKTSTRDLTDVEIRALFDWTGATVATDWQPTARAFAEAALWGEIDDTPPAIEGGEA